MMPSTSKSKRHEGYEGGEDEERIEVMLEVGEGRHADVAEHEVLHQEIQ